MSFDHTADFCRNCVTTTAYELPVLIWIVGDFVTINPNSKIGGTITDEALHICVDIFLLFTQDSLTAILINKKIHGSQKDAFCVESYNSLLDRPEAGVQVAVALDWFRRIN
jgi:hypothetical protein